MSLAEDKYIQGGYVTEVITALRDMFASDQRVEVVETPCLTIHNYGFTIAVAMEGRTNVQRTRYTEVSKARAEGRDPSKEQRTPRYQYDAVMKMRLYLITTVPSWLVSEFIGHLENWISNKQERGRPSVLPQTNLISLDIQKNAMEYQIVWHQCLEQMDSDEPPIFVEINEVNNEFDGDIEGEWKVPEFYYGIIDLAPEYVYRSRELAPLEAFVNNQLAVGRFGKVLEFGEYERDYKDREVLPLGQGD